MLWVNECRVGYGGERSGRERGWGGNTLSWPFAKTSRHFWGNLIGKENNNGVRSLFKGAGRSTDLWHLEAQERGARGKGGRAVPSSPHPPTAFILVSSELFSECLPGKFNGCGIWTGKKRRWKFQRKRGFVPHEGSTSVCVLPGRSRGRSHQRRQREEERQRAFPANSAGLLS